MITTINEFRKFINLNEGCEGDIDDIQSYIRKRVGDYELLHYGFDYIEVRLNNSEQRKELDELFEFLTDKFDDFISEIYEEETGWFKIYFKWKGD
jgi:hypothetical protein